jgi:hypothetical protein
MTKHSRQRDRNELVPRYQIRMAKSDTRYPDSHLMRLWFLDLHSLDGKIGMRRSRYGSDDFHQIVLRLFPDMLRRLCSRRPP